MEGFIDHEIPEIMQMDRLAEWIGLAVERRLSAITLEEVQDATHELLYAEALFEEEFAEKGFHGDPFDYLEAA